MQWKNIHLEEFNKKGSHGQFCQSSLILSKTLMNWERNCYHGMDTRNVVTYHSDELNQATYVLLWTITPSSHSLRNCKRNVNVYSKQNITIINAVLYIIQCFQFLPPNNPIRACEISLRVSHCSKISQLGL